MSALLAAADLGVLVGARPLLASVSFSLQSGQSLTVLGESGAGKSLLAQALMGALPSSLTATGSVTVEGKESRAEDRLARRPLWGRRLALLPQEPGLALDPLMRLKPQLGEVFALVAGMAEEAADAAAQSRLSESGLADAAGRYPWQISGGMAQRAAALIALAGGGPILIVDEPTKGLDHFWRDRVIAMLKEVTAAGGVVVAITHDLRVARALGGGVMILQNGAVVEEGCADQVFIAPQHPFTQALLRADPAGWERFVAPQPGDRLVTVENLAMGFGARRLFEGLNVAVARGERLVLQGPSGVGKSTLGNGLIGLLAPMAGRIMRAAGLSSFAFQKLYQDPVASFPEFLPLRQALDDAVRLHKSAWGPLHERLEALGIDEAMLARRPSQVSGGELQRIAIARALLPHPALVMADEPTSRLDPVTQQKAIRELIQAVDEVGAGLVLITHDEDIARAIATSRLTFAETGAISVQ